MKRAIEVLNQLVGEGILRNYAIGGAMGAAFYSTFDMKAHGLATEAHDA
ncbi:MAG: hypothetical protein IK066_01670 [Kiritimatiellae bacterium]|nr:hypothetical protein [Kiritimatiellia bacterium]